MNRRYGLSAADTLAAAQSLYEKKLITYPRTDSRYLGSDMKREIPDILRSLRAIRPEDIDRLDLSSLRFTGRIIDDRKVSDHHAIIPTGSLPGALGSAEQKVFDAVVTRLIAAFYPPCEKEVTTVHARVERGAVPSQGLSRASSPAGPRCIRAASRTRTTTKTTNRRPCRRSRRASGDRTSRRSNAARRRRPSRTRRTRCWARWRPPASWSTTNNSAKCSRKKGWARRPRGRRSSRRC